MFITQSKIAGISIPFLPEDLFTALEKLYLAMKNKTPEIVIPEETRVAALKPIQRMLEMSFATPTALMRS